MTLTKKKSLIKSSAFRILYPLSEKYLSKERSYKYKDISLKVQPGVFHPGFYFSTKLLLKFLDDIDLNNKYLLELGAGTGLISVYSAKRGAIVTASDISSVAVDNIKLNVELNNLKVEVINSDLFDKIPRSKFDYIIINPPYYKKTPKMQKEFAWFCGDDFQYFRKLFLQLKDRADENTNVIMILSDEADIETIKSVAAENKFLMQELVHKKIWGENQFIFRIKSLKYL
jgi:release factor glutamine methyltransferase